METFSLKNRVAVVTGGYGYLGAAMCRALANFGAEVVCLGKSEENFNAAFSSEDRAHISFRECDIVSSSSIHEAMSQLRSSHGGIDVLVNNAFFVKGQNPIGIDDSDWANTIEGTLSSVYKCIREALPLLQAQGRGKIINIGSMYGMVAPDFDVYTEHPQFLNPPHYGAAKAGVLQLTRYFAKYLGRDSIQVNAISPGPFPNKKVQENDSFICSLEQRTAVGRIGVPEDLVGALILLASSASDYITGQNIVVDGGWTLS